MWLQFYVFQIIYIKDSVQAKTKNNLDYSILHFLMNDEVCVPNAYKKTTV